MPDSRRRQQPPTHDTRPPVRGGPSREQAAIERDAARQAFKQGFMRNKRDNLWREVGYWMLNPLAGTLFSTTIAVMVVADRYGGYSWRICEPGSKPTCSESTYPTEEHALDALFWEVERRTL